MTDIVLGEWEDGRPAVANLETLKRTGLLVQASSGGGKSWLLRRLAEQLIQHMPIIIIDPEGEFSSLREKFDLVLVSAGEGADTPADVRSAGMMAHRLLELGCSAVCDLFELLPELRHEWVAKFLDALDNAPKRLWRDVAVITDEAHIYMPERGEGDSPALGPMTAMATRGRKRGYLVADFTQRLAGIRKTGAAELKNVLVGRTVLDSDKDRARNHLGVPRRKREEFDNTLRKLQPGRFFGIGPAIGDEAALMRIGRVVTSHPEPGTRAGSPPPPTAKIRHLLPQLSDLPSEAKDKEEADGKASEEIARLNAQVRRLTGELEEARIVPQPPAEEIEVERVPDGLVLELDVLGTKLTDLANLAEHVITQLRVAITDNDVRIKAIAQMDGRRRVPPSKAQAPRAVRATSVPESLSDASLAIDRVLGRAAEGDSTIVNREGAWRMLRALASRHPKPLTIAQVGTLAGNASTTGTFRQYMAMLKRAEFVTVLNKVVTITPAGLSAAGEVEKPKGTKALLAMWREKIDRKGAREILDLFAREHGPFTKARVTELIGCENTGTFRQYFAKLVRNDLVVKTKGGFVINPELAL